MDQIPVAAAARVLGLTERGLRAMMRTGRISDASRAGEPASVLASDVDRVLNERRTEASWRQRDATAFARQVRNSIWPDEQSDTVVLADGRREVADVIQAAHIIKQPRGRDALRTLNPDAVALFGRAAVETAAMPRDVWGPTSCRWCYADASARALGGLRPADSPAYRALLGAEPCPQDRARWQAEAAGRKAAEARMRAQLATDRRQAEQARARQDFRAARDALSAASVLHSTAVRRLASVDPAAALTAASGAVRGAGARSACGCTRTRYCPGHAAVFGTTDRTQAHR
ncbi:hypothetical protein [Streptomyces sp. NPDC001221]